MWPAWSPDGSKIAFNSERYRHADIYIINVDGSGEVRVTTEVGEDYQPAWSPDSSWLAFTSDRDGNREVYVMKADGSGQTNITNNPAEDTRAAWSPVVP
jgi:Tol biopolymer transport system component